MSFYRTDVIVILLLTNHLRLVSVMWQIFFKMFKQISIQIQMDSFGSSESDRFCPCTRTIRNGWTLSGFGWRPARELLAKCCDPTNITFEHFWMTFHRIFGQSYPISEGYSLDFGMFWVECPFLSINGIALLAIKSWPCEGCASRSSALSRRWASAIDPKFIGCSNFGFESMFIWF